MQLSPSHLKIPHTEKWSQNISLHHLSHSTLAPVKSNTSCPVTSAETCFVSHPICKSCQLLVLNTSDLFFPHNCRSASEQALLPCTFLMAEPTSDCFVRLHDDPTTHSAGCCHRTLSELVTWLSNCCPGLKSSYFIPPPFWYLKRIREKKISSRNCHKPCGHIALTSKLAVEKHFNELLMSWTVYLLLTLKETWPNLGNGVIPEVSKLLIHLAWHTLNRDFSLHFKMFTFSFWTWGRDLHFNK